MADFKNVIEQVIPLLDDCCEYSNDMFNITYGVDENFLYGTGI
ncbi:hypothetical protein [Providencia burhodogranariea]|uniref:Uncharacterized protein n=1 Tax=Providencia burhodogranariea DSM 19968 TaxID=1141662 RepID=K8W0U9_9GAMM|nr:hypothetical protein [Providencia burhodogranariea]EKT54173.1 hypothetical protein OOA_18284 [Providencia burhodogranariea DSM 19968]